MADRPDPVDLAARALRHRDRSRRQIDERLARAGVPDDGREEALETLERLGYLDDERFAAGRAEALVRRGYGDDGVRQLLASEGASEAAIDAALAALEPEAERARRIVEQRGASARTAAQLQRKGFGEDAVAAAAGGGIADAGPEA